MSFSLCLSFIIGVSCSLPFCAFRPQIQEIIPHTPLEPLLISLHNLDSNCCNFLTHAMKRLELLFCLYLSCFGQQTDTEQEPSWLVNYPTAFRERQIEGMEDVRNDLQAVLKLEMQMEKLLKRLTTLTTDGEVIDSIEHYFWGMKGGIAIELGALDGTPTTNSMTYEYEKSLGWRRILIDANPTYRTSLLEKSPLSFSANAAICAKQAKVHYVIAKYIGGILEFMDSHYMKKYHTDLYNAGIPPGNISSLDFEKYPDIKLVECIPLSHILKKAQITHVNYFMLDVEGGELQVLKSINWNQVKFDVLCIEVDPDFTGNMDYGRVITSFLAPKGYVNATGLQGRNIWFIHKDFIPSVKPGLDPQFYSGVMKMREIAAKEKYDEYVTKNGEKRNAAKIKIKERVRSHTHKNPPAGNGLEKKEEKRKKKGNNEKSNSIPN